MRWVCWGQGRANKTMQVRVCAGVCAGSLAASAGGTGRHLHIYSHPGRLQARFLSYLFFFSPFFFNFLKEDRARRSERCRSPRQHSRAGQGRGAAIKTRRALAAAALTPGTPKTPPLDFSFSLFLFRHRFFQFYLQKQSVPVTTAGPLCPGGRSRHQTGHFALGRFPFFRFIFPFFFFLPQFFFQTNKQKKPTTPNPAHFGGARGQDRGGLIEGGAGTPPPPPPALQAPSSVGGRKFHPFLLLSLIAKPDPHHVLLQV